MVAMLLLRHIRTSERCFTPRYVVVVMTVQKVGIAIHGGVQALDVAGPMDAFTEANSFVAASDRYEVLLIAASLDPIRASNSMRMLPNVSFAQADGEFGILLVAGGPECPDLIPDSQTVEFLRHAPRRAAIY